MTSTRISRIPPARRKITRIRCVQECIKCFQTNSELSASLCYVPLEVQYYCAQAKVTIKLYPDPQKTNTKKVKEIVLTPESILFVSGEEFFNSHGKWLRCIKFRPTPSATVEIFNDDLWYLIINNKVSDELPVIKIVPAKKHSPHLLSWEEVVEQKYSLQLPEHKLIIPEADERAVNQLRQVPPSWTLQQDEALVKFMSLQMTADNDTLGSIKNVVESLDVSTSCDEDGAANLTDNDPDTYWESDGTQGQHWIQLRMKKGTIIKKLCITLCSSDDNYLPSNIQVQGGDVDMKNLATVNPDRINGKQDVVLLSNVTEHYPIIKIRFKECKSGGIDTRVRGIKVIATGEKTNTYDRDFFTGDNLVRFPRLQAYSADQLYNRSQVVLRFITLLDSVLQYIIPAWNTSAHNKNPLEGIRGLLPLSKRRMSLVDTCLKDSAHEPPEKPLVHINRRLAMEHRCNPGNDPMCKNSIFNQLYDGLKPQERNAKPLDYRWNYRHDQWWECKFTLEGIIDQGGGFRDSLSDVAEELCPSNPDCPVPLPYFMRAPNQEQDVTSVNTDVYVPNPLCLDKEKYIWIGQLMGACFRSRENLVISISMFIWKKLINQTVTWSTDFISVDSLGAVLIDQLETMDSATFNAVSRSWSYTSSNGTTVILKMDDLGNSMTLKYDQRVDYCNKVRECRMKEFDEQINYIRTGLLQVIPKAVLDLLTWQELESKVCGDPDISIEALKKSTHYDEVEENDDRIKFLWEALKNFSNEDRSKYIKFVTGRRRLPATIQVSSGKIDAVDSLPESSTCANMLYLPYYSNAKVAEEKIRYAAYNCVAIDTDLNPLFDE